jgi:sugar O-acyltransferase (sialic acid O-acetyltransferase NeuD family)
MKEQIILVGGGGHCRSCIDVIEQQDCYHIGGIVDMPDKVNQTFLGYPVIGVDEDLPRIAETCRNFLITLGQIKSPARRIALFDLLKGLGVCLPTIFSPRAYVSRHATVGEGTIVMHNALVNAGAQVGCNSILNSYALVEHDAQIGDHCHISTAAIVNGGTTVAARTFVGSNAVTRQGIRIGAGSIIGGGVAVMHDIEPQTIFMGKK